MVKEELVMAVYVVAKVESSGGGERGMEEGRQM